MYGEEEANLHTLTTTIDRGTWRTLSHGSFTPNRKLSVSTTHPLDVAVEKRKPVPIPEFYTCPSRLTTVYFNTIYNIINFLYTGNRALRRIGRKKEEVAGGWRRLHKEELHNLYASPNILRVIKLRSPCAARGIRIVPP
jgi:hypothetical protein